MEKIIEQLLGLLWGALPTAVIVGLLYFFLRWSFWKPLERVLAEREAATAGARKAAEETLAQANEKLHLYEESLRRARAEIHREQEAVRHRALEERHQVLRETREQANKRLRQAQAELAAEIDQAKKKLEAESQLLADEITRSLLSPAGGRRDRPEGRSR
jgi:F0F1-type ATP synthase membrane subunit b/b'